MLKTDQEIFVTILLVVLLFLFLSIVIVFVIFNYKKKQQKHFIEIEQMQQEFYKQLLQSQIEVQEATLSTLGKELHDNIGQLLSTAKMLLGITELNLTNPPDTLITANATVGKAITELRSLSKSLNKEWLEKFDLIENLTTEVNRINSANAVQLHLSHPDKLLLGADKQIILFRIIQEAIQNAIKHASAKNIYINIALADALLTTTVKDDGSGFDQAGIADGVGIVNMKYRAKLLSGAVEWQSSSSGSAVLIILPVKQNES